MADSKWPDVPVLKMSSFLASSVWVEPLGARLTSQNGLSPRRSPNAVTLNYSTYNLDTAWVCGVWLGTYVRAGLSSRVPLEDASCVNQGRLQANDDPKAWARCWNTLLVGSQVDRYYLGEY